MMRSTEVRTAFLDYFQQQDHLLVPSSSVVPHGDKTLLFTNAGMVQFKDVFTGRDQARHPRATSVQKCIRAGGKHNDLDNVGYTTRHLTFFEMLGNFSFGDYFKREAIAYAWELVTKGFGLDPAQLWITVFHEDGDARELWRSVSGLPGERIVGLGAKDNYWSMGEVGPCGPCSEILVDRGDAYGAADVENGERFFEIWNLVFMQFNQDADGEKTPLPRPSIDTGMGLERMAMVLQEVGTVFETDIFQAVIRRIEELSGSSYDPGPAGVAHRVLADHLRSLVFALADGAEISNEGRGYVVRRILRRASRYGRKIYTAGPILCQLVDTLVDAMGDAYPEIAAGRELITRLIRLEEERFGETLDRGIELFEDVARRLRSRGESRVPGDEVFKLYDTFGFPVDLVERMAEEAGLEVDIDGFGACMEAQRQRSKAASGFSAAAGAGGLAGGALSEEAQEVLARLPETEFVGYDSEEAEAEIQYVPSDRDSIFGVVLSRTPFYGESGGQIGDAGWIEGEGFRLAVLDTRRHQGRVEHICRLEEGDASAIRRSVRVRAIVDHERRAAIRRHHSATHLLHAALREVLGPHVRQKGSLVAPDRLRFDVTHYSAISSGELEAAAEIVRSKILENILVETRIMSREEAVDAGALAFFGEKYEDRVRVVRIGDFSMELCGGTHVERTGDIGPFVLVGEGSVSSGVRRLEALTGEAAEEFHRSNARSVEQLCRALKVQPGDLLERVEHLLEENRELRARAEKKATASQRDVLKRTIIGDITFVRGILEGVGGRELRGVYDGFKQESERLISVLLARAGEKVQILVTVSPALVAEGWTAKSIFDAGAEVLQARGGGRPEMLQAGGSAPGGAEAALDAIEQRIRQGP
ncbi:MAG: alanine--tRNA ligase [Planctomycetes bacterium]|nr:alanine--tRNA ligase [Planctomycetota bacterium]